MSWMDQTSILRHFVDMFGTVAGCALFGGYVARLKEFAEISGIMREGGMGWKFPLVKWSGENDCPAAVRKVIKQALRGQGIAALPDTQMLLFPLRRVITRTGALADVTG